MFISRSSLWTKFDCANAEKTRVYLERSNTSPINLSLNRNNTLSTDDLFPNHPPLRLSTRIPINHGKIAESTKHHHPPVSVRASSRRSGHRCHLSNWDKPLPRTRNGFLQRRPLVVACVSSETSSHGVTVEEHGKPHVIRAIPHASGQYIHHTTSRLLRRRIPPPRNQTQLCDPSHRRSTRAGGVTDPAE